MGGEERCWRGANEGCVLTRPSSFSSTGTDVGCHLGRHEAPKSDAPVAPTTADAGNSLFRDAAVGRWPRLLLGGGAKGQCSARHWLLVTMATRPRQRQKFSPDGRTWHQAWRPNWSVARRYDVAIHRVRSGSSRRCCSGETAAQLLQAGGTRLAPEWVNQPTPTDLTCENPQLVGKGVCNEPGVPRALSKG